ncbi:heme ABC exporter ATP-binding protein CcmA [Bosea thiooxidans]
MRLRVENLSCRRGGRLIFEGVSLSLGRGEVLALTGRNGAGKSSLIAMLCGRLRPDGGVIRVEGADDAELTELSHLVGHRDGLKTALTARENLAFAQDLLGNPAASPESALEAVGLAHVASLPVGYLSAGQRRRVALARICWGIPLRRPSRRSKPSGWLTSRRYRSAICRPASGGGWRWRGCCSRSALTGSSTSRCRRSMQPRRRCWQA